MCRLLHTLAASALLAAGSAATAQQLTPCDVQVTRERDEQEMACQTRLGPPSGQWDVRETSALDACLERAQLRYKAKRWQCHGILFPRVPYSEL